MPKPDLFLRNLNSLPHVKTCHQKTAGMGQNVSGVVLTRGRSRLGWALVRPLIFIAMLVFSLALGLALK